MPVKSIIETQIDKIDEIKKNDYEKIINKQPNFYTSENKKDDEIVEKTREDRLNKNEGE